MSTISVGELVVRCLRAEGVDLVTGIIDGAHIPIVARTAACGIRYVNARHEEAAVHIAEGYARIARKAVAVLGNPACGTANMLAGLMSAHGEGHPVLALSTLRARIKSDPNRGGTWQAADTENMARPITKYAATVRQWQRIPEMMRTAFRAMWSGRPGPAYLAIPDELLVEEVEESVSRQIEPACRYRPIRLGAGDPAAIEEAAELLAAAERPYIHAGKGVLWADAAAELMALGEHLAAPFTSTLGARGVVPEDHPRYFPPYDLETLSMVRNEADVVLVVGSRLGEYDGWGMPPVWGDPRRQRTIQIDADPLSIGLNRPVDVPIVADAKSALAALLAATAKRRPPRGDNPDVPRYREAAGRLAARGMEYLAAAPSHGVNPAQMVTTVRQFLPRDCITVLDGGNTTLIGVAFHPIFVPYGFLYSVKMGYLGTGLPFALGAKLAAPDRAVCLITGDGALGFNIMELETAVREDLAVLVVVAVDDAWGMEKTAFLAQGLGPRDWEGRGIDVAPVAYDEIARAMGCHGERVASIEELAPALERAQASGKPAVIHVEVDRELNTRPPGWEQFRAARALQA
ncbi:MAG: thiamine pyrophosphate-binding protein [Candidatus Dadabacteria bacterium]|nr:MAG: thiamine pyrophosphate-binding protein [Candidatus Dadabacteria bacterium]